MEGATAATTSRQPASQPAQLTHLLHAVHKVVQQVRHGVAFRLHDAAALLPLVRILGMPPAVCFILSQHQARQLNT